MRRIIPVLAACVLVLIAFLSFYDPGEGCNGGCYSTPEIGEGPCLLGHDAPRLLGAAVLDRELRRPLCLIEITLGSGISSNSYVEHGEADTFYVRSGTITFTLNDVEDWDLDIGFVRVVPGPEDNPEDLLTAGLDDQGDGSYLAELGDGPFNLSAGGGILLDNQNDDVGLSYANNDGEEAILVITSAPLTELPEGTPVASPEP
jgi:hypothetical protein